MGRAGLSAAGRSVVGRGVRRETRAVLGLEVEHLRDDGVGVTVALATAIFLLVRAHARAAIGAAWAAERSATDNEGVAREVDVATVTLDHVSPPASPARAGARRSN